MSHEDIVCTKSPAILVGGVTTDQALADLRALVSMAELKDAPIVAADGGAAQVLRAGLTPDAVIGDFDSLDDATRAAIPAPRLHHIPEQETTDFDKALRSLRAPVILGAGFHGSRFDHHLAALHTLTQHPDRPCILVGAEDLTCLCPPRLQLTLDPGDWVSLFPMGSVRGRSEGLDWPIDGLTMSPMTRIGTSNRTTTGEVRVTVDAPALMLIVPRRGLRPLLAALSRSDARWPSRAG